MTQPAQTNPSRPETEERTRAAQARDIELRRPEASRAGTLARGLGWFSIGLGLSELFAPRRLSRAIGMSDGGAAIMPLLGVREIVSGIGILSRDRPAGWVKARVAGDVMDLAVLTAAFGAARKHRVRLGAATAAVLGVTALDVLCSKQQSAAAESTETYVLQSITIQRPAAELYGFWRQLENVPKVLSHIQSVQPVDERRSHWIANFGLGMPMEWDSEIWRDEVNKAIAWRSAETADVPNEGSVTFEEQPEDHGTLVRVQMKLRAPGARFANAMTGLLGQAAQQRLAADLRRWKQRLETGEVPTTHGQPHGRRTAISRALP